MRYWTVLNAIGERFERRIRYFRYGVMRRLLGPPAELHRDLALVALGESTFAMRFAYHTDPREPDELLRSGDWRTLRTLLLGFHQASRELDMTPLVLFIPTKYRIYGPLATQGSGAGFLALRRQQPPSAPSARGALARLAEELGLELVDLTPDFAERAERGELLYAPFDTHWNAAGRQAAAERVTRRLAAGADAPRGHRAVLRAE